MDHVNEALEMGFDDNSTKFKGKNHFVVRTNLYFLKRKNTFALVVFKDTFI